ncbi:MAG: FAS1-like dehydratase domain-containing protein [Streptosporangiaceae bacterium]
MCGEAVSAGHEQHGWIRDPGTPYEVSRVKIAEFAEAIGDPNPAYRDRAAARQAGYPDVIAPPTFGMVVALPGSIAAARDAFPGTGSPIVVHVEQRFDYARPIRAGDVLHVASAVTGIREMRRSVMVTTRTEIRAADGEHICTACMTLATLPGDGNGERPRHA